MAPYVLPKISVIIATYNSAKTIEKAIQSFLNQTYENKELLIVDGASKDSTLALLKNHQSNIAWQISEPDHGVYSAWNKAIPNTSGDWILFLGSDDYFFDQTVLARTAHILAKVPDDIKITYGKILITNAQNEALKEEGEPWEKYQKRCLDEMVIPHQGTFHRKTVFLDYGLFCEKFKICGDFEFLLRLFVKRQFPLFLPDIVVSCMQTGGLSSTYANVKLINYELYLARKINGLSFFNLRLGFRYLRYYIRFAFNFLFGANLTLCLVKKYRTLIGNLSR